MNDASADTRNVVDEYRGMSVRDIGDDMRARSFDFHVAIENFQHDLNIGSVVRSANAFNVRAVHIIGKKHWNKRGAMATDKYLDVFYYSDVSAFADWMSQQQLSIVGVDNIPSSRLLSSTKLPRRCVLVMGQEGPGLSEEMASICDHIVAIEQFGSTRSINVGAAAAIVMYAWISEHHLSRHKTKSEDTEVI
jgi:tRNA G18 (ribose-2'-O)-methylase SpoU